MEVHHICLKYSVQPLTSWGYEILDNQNASASGYFVLAVAGKCE